ncbi:MAG: protein-glutamate O-methyltransferase CheR [Pseudomonadota bacterium]
MGLSPLTDQEFAGFRKLLYEVAGIDLSDAKKLLVSGRLAKRLRERGLASYGEYLRLLTSGRQPEETQIAIDLLTTNETYFFREPKHFDYLRDKVLPQHRPGTAFRVWSAACSTGQEPYSIAMLLADSLGDAAWEVTASDLSTRVLERARGGLYPMAQAEHIPVPYLKAYCLKGIGSQTGNLLIERRLRNRIRFLQVNLNQTLPQVGEFDVIFLRNVMIYFDMETKQQVVRRLLAQLKRGGHLFIGHSESLNGVSGDLQAIAPAIYRKP